MTLSSWLTLARRVAIAVVMMVILFRPSWGEVQVPTQRADLDVLVVIDRTRSMIAEDGPGGEPRMVQVKKDLRQLSRELSGSRIAAITFGGDVVRTELPFTTDTSAFTALLDTMKVEGPFDGVGSRVDRPLEDMLALLERDQEQYPDRRRIVVLVTDGENTAGGNQQSFAPLTEYTAGGAVLGYGTTDGGRMLVDEEEPDRGYMTDDGGDDALSRIDLENLESIAGQFDAEFLHRTGTGKSPIVELVDSFDSKELASDSTQSRAREVTWVAGLVLIPLLLWELWGARRRVREVRRIQG